MGIKAYCYRTDIDSVNGTTDFLGHQHKADFTEHP